MISDYAPEWLCRRMVEESGDAIIFADRQGIIRLWNRGAAAIFGFTAAEAVGQPLDLIIPPPLRARHGAGYRRVMDTGETRYGRDLLAVPGLRQDGARISLEFTISLIRDDQGAVLGAGAVIRDVTDRWERDRAVKERLATLEALTDRAPRKP